MRKTLLTLCVPCTTMISGCHCPDDAEARGGPEKSPTIDASADADAGTGTGTGTDAGTDADTDAGTDTGPYADTDTGTDTNADVNADADATYDPPNVDLVAEVRSPGLLSVYVIHNGEATLIRSFPDSDDRQTRGQVTYSGRYWFGFRAPWIAPDDGPVNALEESWVLDLETGEMRVVFSRTKCQPSSPRT